MSKARVSLAAWCCALSLVAGLAVAKPLPVGEDGWPLVPLPAQAKRVPLPEQISVNGLVVRQQLFESNDKPKAVTDWFRKQWGEPLVENAMGGRLVLGKAVGGHYVTVQLSALAGGTQGLVAVSDLQASVAGQQQHHQQAQEWAARLPPGTQVLQHVATVEAGKRSEQWLMVNQHSVQLNAELLRAQLEQRGYAFQRELASRRAPGTAEEGGRTLLFAGPSGEAMATLSQGAQQRVSVLLNLQPTGRGAL